MLTAADRPQRPPKSARLNDVAAWIAQWATPLAEEEVPLARSADRVLARGLVAALDLPPFDRAIADGFAVRAEETVGAGVYNPMPFRLGPASAGVTAGCAVALQSGDSLPAGADAVVRLEHGMPEGPETVAVIAPVFVGSNVEGRGSQLARGSTLLPAGRRLDASAIALLAAAGLARVPMVARPRVRCVLSASCTVAAGRELAAGEVHDANGPLLATLVERDGGAVVDLSRAGRSGPELRQELERPGADIVLVAGGTGPGSNDHAATALAEAGELVVHGVAMRPGETAGAGRVSGIPVFLLPGASADCLWAYELIAGRAVRQMGGRSPELPYRAETLRAARKIVSEVGTVEICPVRRSGDGDVAPIPAFAEAGLVAAVHADGFVIVPEASEGYPQGAPVTVYLRR